MKTALVFGSSGLVGQQLVQQLIQNNSYQKIKLFVRKKLNIQNHKVEFIETKFDNLEILSPDIKGDDCFFCIGTTKKNSPEKSEYQRVELELPKKIANLAKQNDLHSFIFVSSGYANSKSSGDYLRFKGLVEEELISLKFTNLGILRPSFLLGDRKEKRIGEKIGIIIFKILSPFMIGPLKRMKPIHVKTVAGAMIKIAQLEIKQSIFESDEIVKLNEN
ncbi:NmrA family protein [alpha proteobacterium HIMB59]|nr:NmrA family protein [alpha proteobacterium HIMB59]